MAAASLKKGDVAIGISNSGSTKDVVDALAAARKSWRGYNFHYQF
jgi:DNA-binding MurR/RpiR family transcriptional regulator